jgi:serine/threonine protein kinase
LAREIEIWRSLQHANVLELLGVVVAEGTIFTISPWATNERLVRYVRRQPDVNRLSLVRIWICGVLVIIVISPFIILQILGVADGLAYLHYDMNIIHGDIKAVRVYMSALALI